MTGRALAGLRVLDISTSVAGAWCSRLLADFGATVVMAEPPGGHVLRATNPRGKNGRSILAAYVFANKQSLTLDADDSRDQAALRALARESDVVVSSAGLSRLAAAGLTYGDFGQPDLIMAHITPYGLTGDLADHPANDLAVAARSGWASINGEAQREPLKPSGSQVSYCAGLAAYSAIAAALHHRDHHPGEGQELEVAELDVMVAAFAPALLRGQYADILGRRGEADITNGPVPVADGHFALTISRAHFWRDAMNLLELPDLADDARWNSAWYRQAHREDYVGRVQERMLQWNRMELFGELAARRVVAGPVLSMAELEKNEHLRSRGFWVRPAKGPGGPEYPGAPFRMSETSWALHSPAPEPGPRGAGTGANRSATPAMPVSLAGVQGTGAGPLNGLRGIVLTQAWAGSFCTELLGFLGADIIQVEVRKRPDSWRGSYDAPLAAALREVATARHPWNCNFLYNSVNLNKRCVTLDLQTAEGLALFQKLIPHADFVAENFAPRVLGNLGIDYEAMRAIRPDIILCSLSAYGHEGPWANVPGIGGTIEPTSGMSALLGYEDGPPMNSGQMYPDAVAGFYGCAAILTALHHRNRTGRGQYIDLSMQEANLTFVGDAALEYLSTGRQRARLGNRHPDCAPHGIYPCCGTDRWLALACLDDAQWLALCTVAGRPDWAGDSRFTSPAARKTNEKELDEQIRQWTVTADRDEAARRLAEAGVVAAPVLDAGEVGSDSHLRGRGMVAKVSHGEAGNWWQAVNPLRFSRTPATEVRPAPMLGEHSLEVLAELLGLDASQYEALAAAGVTGTGPPPEARSPGQ